ncbi:hypothetical protein [Sporosarcina sp. Marseille-Q4943]|uniref:hypothetical protein n=1 Tax=Sporosarcina sp. Marseille-Q4943 TaxID=2942204 RepID=UPI00208DB8D6|nr:hypothetical protein [Sporosarcina sp. Marseille-Q4943]
MTRKIQPVSFNMENEYENGLYEFAMEQDKYFSKYVKRLIEKDRAGGMVVPAAVQTIESKGDELKFNKSTVKAFL